MDKKLILSRMGTRIKLARLKKGLTQNELSELISVDPSYISNIETGKKNISVVVLVNLVDALEILPNDLLCDSIETITPEIQNEYLKVIEKGTPNQIHIVTNFAKGLIEEPGVYKIEED